MFSNRKKRLGGAVAEGFLARISKSEQARRYLQPKQRTRRSVSLLNTSGERGLKNIRFCETNPLVKVRYMNRLKISVCDFRKDCATIHGTAIFEADKGGAVW